MATANVWDGVTNPVPRAVYKILSILRCAIDDEVIAVLTNFLVFQHEDGGIAAQFRFSGLEQRTIIHKKRDSSTSVSNYLPLLKRGIEGDLSNKISPNPSFSKRGTE